MIIPRATHPWKLLKRELDARWRSQKDFANILWKTTAEVNDIISGKRNITIDWALRLEYALWISHEVRIWIQNKRDSVQLLKQKEKMELLLWIKHKAQELVFA